MTSYYREATVDHIKMMIKDTNIDSGQKYYALFVCGTHPDPERTDGK